MVVPGELGGSTSSQWAGRWTTVLVPLGATEQHGPHLPLDTDTRIAVAVARAAAARLAGASDAAVTVAPPIGYGASGEHQSFPGTISIGTEALTELLVEFGRSAGCWAQRVVFVNGHGGNLTALRAAVRRLRGEARDVAWVACAAAGADAHAGHTETSLLLHLCPEVVRHEAAVPGNLAPLAELLPALRRGGLAAVSAVGVLGDPTTATAAEGARLLAEMVETAVAAITGWAPRADGALR